MPVERRTDVAIVGGGVAGSALAAGLADAGFGVVLIEREPRFRDRVRGEGLHPWGVKAADALGLRPALLAAGARELMIWQVYAGRQPVFDFRWDDDRPGWPGEWSVYHPDLQQALLDHAAARGVQVLRPARVTSVRLGREPELTVALADGEQAVRANLVVGADGRQSAARGWIGARTIRDPLHHQIGGCLLENVEVADDRSHFGFMSGAYSIIFPQGNGRARTYYIALDPVPSAIRGNGHEQAFIQACAAAYPEGMLGAPNPAGPLAFFPGIDIWSDRLYGERLALIGDAAGANDPSLGNGLSIAFRDAQELRDWLVHEPDWQHAVEGYAQRRATYFAVLRAYAQWQSHLWLDLGPEADERRARAQRAAELDPDRMGFGNIVALGPDGAVLSEAARARFHGEDLPELA